MKFKIKKLIFSQLIGSLLMLCCVTEVFCGNDTLEQQQQITQALKFAASGDLNSLKSAIIHGVDINSKDSVFNATALHNAASQGHLHILEWLLAEGANVSAIDIHGSTPLIWAAYNGQTKVVEKLVAASSNVNHVARQGSTALISGIQSGNIDVVKTLLKSGAQKDVLSIDGISPIQAAKTSNHDAMLQLVKSGELN